MKVEHIQAKDAPAPGGSYSHGVVAHGFLYTCGMGPVDPATGKIVDGGVAEQTRQTLKNLQKILFALLILLNLFGLYLVQIYYYFQYH